MSLPIQKPASVSPQPDADTQKGLPPDLTGNSASKRVLHINLYFFKYGTDDKTHAAAIVLSLLLFITILIIIITGMFTKNTEWADKVFNWTGSAFLLISGIALGGRSDSRGKKLKVNENS